MNEVLNYFGKNYESAKKNYRSFLLLEETEKKDLFSRGNFQGIILGNNEFIEQVNHSHQKENLLEKIPLSRAVRQTCAHFSITLEEVQAPGKSRKMSFIRALLATIVSKHPQWSLEELGNILNRDASSLSGLVRRHESKRHASQPQFTENIKKVECLLSQIPESRV